MELATTFQFGIGVKVLVLNNKFQGMVQQWQGGYFHCNNTTFLTELVPADLFSSER
ncbi:hypothetical protein B0H11DRAFT_2017070 [Mycena galericulata]|nr:hypothetical protein B0H11DRAFT_2017070 [Mycena galericulata]